MLQQSTQIIRFVIIRNPLVPDVKIFENRAFVPGQTLADYIGELHGRYAFSVNGRVVNQEDLSSEIPEPGSVVAIAPVPMGGGGGGGKTIVRLVAVVALTVFTYGAGSASLAGMSGLAAGSTSLAVAQAAVMIGGTMLINAMLPYSIKNSASKTDNDSKTYGIDGAKNTSTENIAVPVVYGRHRQAGNIIGNYTTLSGQTQYLHLLINAGEGVIAGVKSDSILVNDQPISSLSDVEYKILHGNDDQQTLNIFDRQITPNQVTINREMKSKDVWTEYTTSVEKDVEGVRLDFLASIYKMDDKGNEVEHSIDVVAEIKPVGAPDSSYVPLMTGTSVSDTSNGWIIDVAARAAAGGLPVTERSRGSQLIDPIRPNIFDPSTGMYRNYYVSDGRKYVLRGDAVTPNGGTSTTYIYTGNGYQGDRGNRYSEPGNTVAERELVFANNLHSYEYGDLFCGDKKVGTYHKFHQANIFVKEYNGTGAALGGKAGQVLKLYGNDASATVRYSFESPRLPAGRYAVRARRLTDDSSDGSIGDSLVLNEVSEIIYSDIAYNHTALLYLKIKVSDQISSVPQVTFENLGRIIRVWDDKQRRWVSSADVDALGVPITQKERRDFPALTEEQHKQSIKKLGTMTPNALALNMPAHILPRADASLYQGGLYRHDNPAWIAWDMMTEPRFGGGLDPSRLDFWAFKRWADYCDEKNLSFRAVIDSRDSLWDAIASVFRVGRATPVRSGTRYTVAVEMPKEPVMSFGVDNMIEGSFSINWLPLNDRANEIELTYYDEAYDYKQRVIKVYDKDSLTKGAKPITSSVKVVGIVSNEQAVREANFALNTNKLVETVSFTAPVEALACTIGDVVAVQHNMMTWGEAGKLERVERIGSTNDFTLTLDHEISFEPGKDWKITLQGSVVERGRFRATSNVGGYVTLEGFNKDAVGRIRRAKSAGLETSILDVFVNSNGEHGIVVRDYDTILPGMSVDLFDTDAMIEMSVTPSVYGAPTSQITIRGSSHVPERFEHFMIGFPEFKSKLFTIRSIGLTGDDMTRQVTALEYDQRVFNDTDTDFMVSDVAYERALEAVSDMEITETPVFDGIKLISRATVAWIHKSHSYKNAEVTAVVNGGPIQNLGRKQNHAAIDVLPGDRVEFTITPYSMSGKQGAVARTGFVSKGMSTESNPMLATGGSVYPINGGAAISGLAFNQYQIQKVEIWCILQGTELPGVVTGGVTANIENVANPDVISSAGVYTYGQLVGYADKMGSFTHIITDKSRENNLFFYWARTVDMLGTPSAMTYIGSARPAHSTAYNDVTVYCLGTEVPPRPIGGKYDAPQPDGTLWQRNPPSDRTPGAKSVIFMSSRRFCSVEELSDPEWSAPAAIYDPNDVVVIEPALAPTNVHITTGFGSIRASWDRPQYEGHDKTQVFVQRVLIDANGAPRSEPALDVDTMLAAEEKATMVSIPATAGYGYYVWVRHVNNAGIKGPVAPTNGGFVTVKFTPEEMNSLLNKQITWDFLDDSSKSTIDKAIADSKASIEAIGETLAKADESIAIATASDGKASSSLSIAQQAAEAGLRLLVEANRSESIRRSQIKGPSGVELSIGDLEDRVLGENGEIKRVEQIIESVRGGASSSVNELSETVALLDASMAKKMEEVAAKFAGVDATAIANVNTLQAAIADTNRAASELATTVAANKAAAQSATDAEILARKTAISEESSARAQDVAALNTSLTTLNSKVNTEITNRQNAISDVNSAMADMNLALSAKIDSANAKTNAEIQDRKTAISTVNQAMSEMETRLAASITANNSAISAEVSARQSAITSVNSAVASLDSKLSGMISTEAGRITTEIADRKTAITTVTNSVASLDTKLSGSIATESGRVTTEIADRKAAVTTVTNSVASLDTKLSGMIATESGRITTEIADRKTAITTVTDSVASLDTKLSGTITTESNRITTEIADRKTAITTVNSSIAALETKLTGQVSTQAGRIDAEISERKAADAGLTSSISSLESKLTASITTESNRITSEIADRKAAVSAESSARALSESAITASINNVSSRVTVTSDALATLDGKYTAQWGVKTSVGALTGGVGFINDGTTTSFLVDAAVFGLISRSSTGSILRSSPFKVVNGKSYISDAYIDAAVIKSITAGQITADYINSLGVVAKTIVASASLESPVIHGGQITIGSNFSVDGAGNMTANSAVLNSVTSQYGTFNNASVNYATMRNCMIEENCTVRGTIYAERIVGDLMTQRSFDTSSFKYYTWQPAVGNVAVLTINILNARPYLRVMRIENFDDGGFVQVSATASDSIYSAETSTYIQVTYRDQVLSHIPISVSVSRVKGDPSVSASNTWQPKLLIEIPAYTSGAVCIKVKFAEDKGLTHGSILWEGGKILASLFKYSDEMS